MPKDCGKLKLKIISRIGENNPSAVYMSRMRDGRIVEFAESLQPPLPIDDKWVIMVSTLFGCPVHCPICDAGSHFRGRLSKDEILSQIDYLVENRFGRLAVPSKQFKIQFARMGEPAFNHNVIDVLNELVGRYDAPGLMPSISTIAPAGRDDFFERLLETKNRLYNQGNFQLQFSIHTTDSKRREKLIPIKKWSFADIAAFGQRFKSGKDRKITLNFALAANSDLDPDTLRAYFDPAVFMVKITPVNPTRNAARNGMISYIDPDRQGNDYDFIDRLRSLGYDVIVSIGDTRENEIGSNCGQYVTEYLFADKFLDGGYRMKSEKNIEKSPTAS